MQQSPSREANRFSAGQEIPHILCAVAYCPAVQYTVQNAWADSSRTATLYITQWHKAIGLTHSLDTDIDGSEFFLAPLWA